MKFSPNDICPCGSLKKYKKCCKPFHDKITFPKTALELMKSRFSAFAVLIADYIIFTTHENNSDYISDLKSWNQDIMNFSKNTRFERLEILDFIEGEVESFVTFKATLFQDNTDISFIEKSRFLKVEDKWLYIDGQFIDEGKK
ncbi:MAG: YchJ family metal-binding protein [Aliarcobacter sp.]|nr:YchJ family metal-binding protein [Aliarcobacter sp.]